MYVVESSVIVSVILISLSVFIDFSMKIERKITKDINDKISKIENEYKYGGDKKFIPDKILRIITNIENIIKWGDLWLMYLKII